MIKTHMFKLTCHNVTINCDFVVPCQNQGSAASAKRRREAFVWIKRARCYVYRTYVLALASLSRPPTSPASPAPSTSLNPYRLRPEYSPLPTPTCLLPPKSQVPWRHHFTTRAYNTTCKIPCKVNFSPRIRRKCDTFVKTEF